MFITREEALKKLNAPDNPFSPSRKGSEDWGRVTEVDDTPTTGSDSSASDPSSAPVHSDSPTSQQDAVSPSAAEIRQILHQVDPSVARDRRVNLKGKLDVQAAIGQTAIIVGRETAGALYDRSYPQTTAYEYGHGHSKSLYGAEKGPAKPELVEKLSAFKEKLAYAAGRVLEKTLDSLDEDKIGKMKKAVNISRVAKDMAVIMDKVSRAEQNDNAVHFHIYRPDMRSVNAYETVKINGGSSVSDPIVIEAPSVVSNDEQIGSG